MEISLFMLKRKFIRVVTDPRMQGPFASPFKVLRDLFNNPPFVADPEFAALDMDALEGKWTRRGSYSSEIPAPAFLKVDRAKFTFLVWFIELILVPLLVLIILELH
jgi:hypothetical protein